MGRKFFAILGVVVFAGILGGCSANSVKLDGAALSKIQHKKLAVVIGERTKLKIMTPAKAVAGSGLLAAVVVDALSDDLAVNYAITDPAIAVSQAISRKLVSKHGMSMIKSHRLADVLLQVTTPYWEVRYGSLAWMSYHPAVMITAKLLDARTKKVLSSGHCQNIKPITKTRGYDEILANNGALLKVDLNQIASKCAQEILAKAF